MNLLVSYITNKFGVLKNFWRRAKENNEGGAFYGTDKSEETDLGGLVQLIDWRTKKVGRVLSLPTPTGFDFINKEVYLAVDGKKILVLDDSWCTKIEITHKWFNDIHSINLTSRGILVSSTGLDCILEVDGKGNELFRWMATEHGYDVDLKGRIRVINQDLDHRRVKYPTLQQTTHLNSALYVGKTRFFEETIYASLFHQGEIVAIDRLKGNLEVVMDNLSHPHSLYRCGGRLIFSDTENGRVILTDSDFRQCKSLYLPGTDWIQDSSLLSNGNLLVCDSNNHRIIETESLSGRIMDEFEYDPEYKIYQAKELVLR